MGRSDLAVGVLKQVAQAAVQHAGTAGAQGGAVMAGRDALTGGFDPDQANRGVIQKPAEDPHGIGPATHAGHHGVRQAAVAGQHLFPGLSPDDRLEVPDHPGKGSGPTTEPMM